MDKDIESFVNNYQKKQNKINTFAEALKATQSLDKEASQTLSDGSTKEISSIFDGSKTIYRASTNGKNVMHFTSPDQLKDYLEK